MPLPFPDDHYLAAVGRSMYAVAYLEQLVLGDLARLAVAKDMVDAYELASKPLGTVSRSIASASEQPSLPPVEKEWLDACSSALVEIIRMRNDLIHAKPATVDGQQRLVYYGGGRHVVVTEQFLDDFVARVEALAAQLSPLRVTER